MSDHSRIFWPPKGQPRRAAKQAQASTELRACDHPDCREPGDYRAPKSREALTEYYWFCLDHVRAYNSAWNFYAGMNPEEIEILLRNDVTWQRPTWPLGKRGSGSRFDASRIKDGFGMFGEDFGETIHDRAQATGPELSAMREMNLSAPLSVEQLRTRYRELCKIHHPDANGGDKEAEERFKRIGQAYKTLMESLL
jgi:hypothetical protein